MNFETLLFTATGTEQPPSKVFMKARSAIVANTVSLKIEYYVRSIWSLWVIYDMWVFIKASSAIVANIVSLWPKVWVL